MPETWFDPDPTGPISRANIGCELIQDCIDDGEVDVGGGALEVFQPVPAAPDDPTKAALAYPAGGGALRQWDKDTQAWV